MCDLIIIEDNKIPNKFKKFDFYKTLSENGCELIVQKDKINFNENINSFEDFTPLHI